MKKLIFITLLISLFGCQSEQEKILAKQKENCKEQIKSGQEPTQFCLNLLPEYRSVAQAPSPNQQPLQQYEPQQYEQLPVQQPAQSPIVVPQPQQPVIVNQQPAQQSNSMTDMLVGGLIGHAIGSSGNNNPGENYSAQPSYDRPRYAKPRVIERNTAIYKSYPSPSPKTAAPAPAPKKNYMGASKLNSYGARPSAPPKSSSMNMGRLSSYGKR